MNKITIYLFVLLASILNSQECDCITVNMDEVTGLKTVYSKPLALESFVIKVNVGLRKSVYPKILFKLNTKNCVDKYSEIYLLMYDGKRIAIKNYVYAYNCNGDSGFILKGKNSNMLKNSFVKTIRVHSFNKIHDSHLSEEESELLNTYINCAYNRKSWDHKL